jgi:hypothetical protein
MKKMSSFNMTVHDLTLHVTSEIIARSSWEVLPHPPYSLNFASADYHLFRGLKDNVKGQHYEDNMVQEAMHGLL